MDGCSCMVYFLSVILEKELIEIKHGSPNWFCLKLITLFMKNDVGF